MQATTVAELDAMTLRLLKAARRVRTTVSIGTAPLDANALDLTRSRADIALYRAKAEGRDTVRHATELDPA